MKNSKILKDLIDSKETLIMPDAYDPISARIIEYLGFKAVQCSGYSFSIASCKKDEIDIDFKENLLITSKIVDSVSIPVMADGEDGFGGVEQISDIIKSYINIGVSGINIEDQVLDKKSNSKVIDSSLMQNKIKTAKSSAKQYGNPDLIINGRTDALNAFNTRQEGLNESIKRANLYLEAGSDLVFVTNVKNLDEAKILVKEINGPLSIAAGLGYNIKNFSINDLKEIGIARVSLPTIAITAIIKALLVSIDSLKKGNFEDILDKELLCNSEDIMRLISK
ncbi:MAG TPA: isocitrate lyase/PEP mutase family protein [Paludibacter sp.]